MPPIDAENQNANGDAARKLSHFQRTEQRLAKAKQRRKDPAERRAALLAEQRERARMLGKSEELNCVEFLRDVRDNGRYDIRARLEANAQLLDRYGTPRNNLVNDLTEEKPKLFVLKKFAAPASYGEQEQPAADQDRPEPASENGESPEAEADGNA